MLRWVRIALVVSRLASLIYITMKSSMYVRQFNFGLFCGFCPKLPRIHVGLRCNANETINREKGYWIAPHCLISSRKGLGTRL